MREPVAPARTRSVRNSGSRRAQEGERKAQSSGSRADSAPLKSQGIHSLYSPDNAVVKPPSGPMEGSLNTLAISGNRLSKAIAAAQVRPLPEELIPKAMFVPSIHTEPPLSPPLIVDSKSPN